MRSNIIWEVLTRCTAPALRFVERRLREWARPHGVAPLALGMVADLTRSKGELLLENALLRQQLIVACRQFKRPTLTRSDRLRLLFFARVAKHWRDAMLLVKPETVLRWYRRGFRLFWRRKTRSPSHKPRLSPETVALIMRMAQENRLWGAERIRGELLKLDIRVSKRRCRSTCAERVVHGPPGNDGQPSCVTMARPSGHATSCRPMTCSSGRSLHSSSSHWNPGRWCGST